ncbi:MAG: UDP-N-acetylmuramoyl-L-alanine--D-glutamate ligase [Epsilonproteobacteria bacterium]|nr:UDP-N-acetylmuramoyl-L-alanine--D-glutamate ligase [Campylobacterota bacterium]
MKPTLLGYGKTTKAIAKLHDGGCTFFDDNTKEAFFDDSGNHILPSHLFDPSASVLEVMTPSFKPSHPLVMSAKNLLSEYDYFLGFEDKKPFNIWISGTNGKTTTTQMITHLLSSKGAISGGNIGTPLAELDFNAPIWVLETSSFTLHYTDKASPNIYLLLPITPDHLDWHGSAQGYTADKLKPLLTMREGEMALIPKGLELPHTNAFVVEYDTNEFLCEYFDIDMSKIRFKGAFLQDAILAMAVVKALFDEVDYDLINSFVIEGHRQEEFRDAKGRLWVNDSKATNVDAALQAIKVFGDKPLHLILGGDDKGVELDDFFADIKPYNPTIYAIGANEEKLIKLSEKFSLKASPCKTIANAVKEIDKNHDLDSVALLAPAAASLDQFSSYKERGDVFMNNVKKL